MSETLIKVEFNSSDFGNEHSSYEMYQRVRRIWLAAKEKEIKKGDWVLNRTTETIFQAHDHIYFLAGNTSNFVKLVPNIQTSLNVALADNKKEKNNEAQRFKR